MKIFYKMLLVLLPLTLLPLLVIGYFAINDAKEIGTKGVVTAKQLGSNIANESSRALTALGEELIKVQAEQIAQKLTLYLADHPTMTLAQLQADPVFVEMITKQKIANKGYMSLNGKDKDNNPMIFIHPDPRMNNMNLNNLRAKLPQLLELSDKVLATNQSIGGYYKWQDPDGAIRDKYIYIAVLGRPTADGILLDIAPSDYIDEFSLPVKNMQSKVEASIKDYANTLTSFTKEITKKDIAIFLIVVVIVILISFLIAQSISEPIIKLKKAADNVTQGNFDAKLPSSSGSSEIAELTASMEMLITALKNKK